MSSPRIPVHVLTGFLGSGKTTLLRHFLSDPALADTAVVINEFGEVGLDHLLVRELTEDVVLLASGCLCCTVRDDLLSTLIDLLRAVDVGEIRPFRRVVVETTGLADPLPILQAIMTERQVSAHFRLGNVITTVDSITGLRNIDQFHEAAVQIAAADRIVITKTDLVSDDACEHMEQRLSAINHTAQVTRSRPKHLPAIAGLLEEHHSAPPVLPKPSSTAKSSGHHHGHSEVGTFVIRFDETVEMDAFYDWLDLLLMNRGHEILRVKGYIRARGEELPLVIHGVQHTVFKPEPLGAWPEARRESVLVFIARHLTGTSIARSLRDSGIAPDARCDQVPQSAVQFPAL